MDAGALRDSTSEMINQYKEDDMTKASNNSLKLTALAGAVLALSACGGSDDVAENKNIKPTYLGAVTISSYDGNSDDLLTAGLGKTGLGGIAPIHRT
jgi:hydroxybutyrate-dimer hydrolase